MKTYWPALRLGGLLLATGALLPSLGGAQALKNVTLPATPATSVSEVDVTRTGHDTTVLVESKGGPLTYHVTRMAEPPRVVVDFDNAIRPAVNPQCGSKQPTSRFMACV